MPKTFYVNIDLKKNQLLNAIIHNSTTAPLTPLEGQIYYNTTDKVVYFWNGTEWKDTGMTASAIKTLYESNDDTNALTDALLTKLNGIEALADVTDATNVDAAGAVMDSDTTTASMSFVIDEDNMVSDSATKIPTQQSVKAYVDSSIGNVIAAADAMVFKGTVGTSGTYEIAAFNSLVVYNSGWTFKVVTAGTIKGIVCQVGDLLLATVDRLSGGVNSDWTVAQTNVESSSESVAGYIQISTDLEVTTGTDDTKAVTPLKLATRIGTLTGVVGANGSITRRYTTLIGNGVLTNIPVTHNLGVKDVISQVFESDESIVCGIINTNTTTSTYNFNVAPTSNQFRVVIIG